MVTGIFCGFCLCGLIVDALVAFVDALVAFVDAFVALVDANAAAVAAFVAFVAFSDDMVAFVDRLFVSSLALPRATIAALKLQLSVGQLDNA